MHMKEKFQNVCSESNIILMRHNLMLIMNTVKVLAYICIKINIKYGYLTY